MNKPGRNATNSEFAQSDEGHGKNTMVDQNGRTIKAETYMNAKLVYEMVFTTGSTIPFSNDETMNFMINSQLDIHPRALDQMTKNSNNEIEEQNDMKKMMELTRDYTASTSGDFTGDRQAAKETYLKKIEPCLKDYQMITQLEIDKIIKDTKSLTQNGTLKNHLDNVTSAEAYRMRIVLKAVNDKRILDLAWDMATDYYRSNKIDTFRLASWVEIANMELKDFMRHNKQKAPSPEDILKSQLDHFKQQRMREIEGLQKEGKTLKEAEQIANENYKKRENKARAKIKHTNKELTGKDMEKIAADNKIERSYSRFHKKQSDNRNKGGLKADLFFRSLKNETAFNGKMSDLRTEINIIADILKTESLKFLDGVAAYYHVRKHGYESWKHFNKKKGLNIPKAEIKHHYLITIRDYLFKDTYFWKKFISQDGSRTRTIYDDEEGYWGVTKCSYNADLGKEDEQPIVATHYPKNTDDPAPKPASTPDTKTAPAFAPAPPKQEDPQNDKGKSA